MKIEGNRLPMMLSLILFFPILAKSQTPLIGIIPILPGEDIKQCWSSLQSVNGCILEIYTSFLTGRVGSLGPACCNAITETQSNCWPKLFPFNPSLPLQLTNYCSKKPLPVVNTAPALAPAATGLIEVSKIAVAEDVKKCLSSLLSTKGCTEEVVSSLLSYQFRLISPKCCKAVIDISQNCLPKIFPFNPFLPEVIQNLCRSLLHLNP
ncbi:hypothetical protein ACHQM5_014762 [Ranunculus cassubicifolius]